MFKNIFAIFLAVAVSIEVLGQHFVTGDDYEKAYSLLLDLKFAEATSLIQKQRLADESNLAPVYLDDLSDFLFIVITEDQQQFELRKELRSERLNALDKLPSNSPYKLLVEGEIHLHWAFSMMRFGEYLNGAREINKAFHALEKNKQKFPDFLPTYKSMGLLHTLIGTVPDNYKWATKLMGVDGSIEQGIGEMESVVSRSEGKKQYQNLRKETLFLLSFLHINLLNDAESLSRIADKVAVESGPLMDFSKASLLKETGKTNEAIKTLENSTKNSNSFPYLNFLLGELKLARMDADASIPLQKYVSSFKGKSYLKAAHQKLAWNALLVKNDVALYKKEISKVENAGNTMLDEDKSAQKEFESGKVPNKILLKARLQFDGGFYKEALSTLISSPNGSVNTADEKLEFTYRLARIHDEMGNDKDAINYYRLTIENGRESNRYFAANSSLMLGMLYENAGRKEEALKAFQACSEFNNSEYKNSINQKAKAGILRLKN